MNALQKQILIATVAATVAGIAAPYLSRLLIEVYNKNKV